LAALGTYPPWQYSASFDVLEANKLFKILFYLTSNTGSGVERVSPQSIYWSVAMFNPKDFSVSDIDNHTAALSRGLAKHFSFDSKKTNKLRDVVCETLFGAESGFQQIKSSLKSDDIKEVSPVSLPMPRYDFDLPDTLYIYASLAFDEFRVEFDHDLHLPALTLNSGESGVGLYEPAIFAPVKSSPGYFTCDIFKSELLRYIANHFELHKFHIDFPSGTKDFVDARYCSDIVKSLGINTKSFENSFESKMSVTHKGHYFPLLIELTRKSHHSIVPMMLTVIRDAVSSEALAILDPIIASKLVNSYSEILKISETAGLNWLANVTKPISINGVIVGYETTANLLSGNSDLMKALLLTMKTTFNHYPGAHL
jgi:hypothetical protein